MYFIYELIDPRDGKPFYGGQTNDPKRRLTTHINQRAKLQPKTNSLTATQERIIEIVDAGFRPEMKVVAYARSWQNARSSENRHLRNLVIAGYSLTNAVSPVGTHGSYKDAALDEIGKLVKGLSIYQQRVMRTVVGVGGFLHIPRGTGWFAAKTLSRQGLLQRHPGDYYQLTDLGKAVGERFVSENPVNLDR